MNLIAKYNKRKVRTHLGSAEHHSVQQDLQFLESGLSWANHTVFLNRCKDFGIPEASMLHRTMPAVFGSRRYHTPLNWKWGNGGHTITTSLVTELPVKRFTVTQFT